ncbi:hypothetical protein Tco_1074271 [Tanacetum coccineum]
MSSFGVKERKFLGHMVTEEGLRADPERIYAIILSLSPRSPYQIQSLFLQLTTISKFIPKLAELKHPLREHVEGTPDANEGGTFTLSKKLQAKSTPTPRAWRLYIGKETIEEGSGVGIILVSPKEKMHSYAIRLKFHASNHVMDYEA